MELRSEGFKLLSPALLNGNSSSSNSRSPLVQPPSPIPLGHQNFLRAYVLKQRLSLSTGIHQLYDCIKNAIEERLDEKPSEVSHLADD